MFFISLKQTIAYGAWMRAHRWYGSLLLWCTTLFITGFIESVMKDKYFGRLMWLIIKAKITT